MLTVQDRQADTAPPMLWRAVLPAMLFRRAAGRRSQACASASGPSAAAGTRTLSGSDWKCRRHATCTSACLTTHSSLSYLQIRALPMHT